MHPNESRGVAQQPNQARKHCLLDSQLAARGARGLFAPVGLRARKGKMEKYFAYWKLGWWVQLLIICLNGIRGATYSGLAFLLQPLLANLFPIAVAVAWLAVGAPIAGCRSEKFAGWSKRVGQDP